MPRYESDELCTRTAEADAQMLCVVGRTCDVGSIVVPLTGNGEYPPARTNGSLRAASPPRRVVVHKLGHSLGGGNGRPQCLSRVEFGTVARKVDPAVTRTSAGGHAHSTSSPSVVSKTMGCGPRIRSFVMEAPFPGRSFGRWHSRSGLPGRTLGRCGTGVERREQGR